MHFTRLLRASTPLSVLGALAVTAATLIGAAPVASAPNWETVGFSVAGGIRMNSFEARLLVLVNEARAQHGIRALIPTAGTTDVARNWSGQMAGSNALSHNPALVANLEHAGSPDWSLIAENVGMGPADDPDLMFAAYMNSPHHRDNILDPQARYVGSGVVERPTAYGVPTAYDTMDFVDSYHGGYGSDRTAASGLSVDAQHLSTYSILAQFRTGFDPRVDTTAAGWMTATRAMFDKPGLGPKATRFIVAEPYRWGGGYAQLRLKDAYDFRSMGHLTVAVAASAPAGRAVDITVSLSQPWSTSPNVILGTVHATSRPRNFTFTIPMAGRTFRNQIVFSVSATSISALSSSPAGRHANIGVFGISAGL